MRRSTTFPTTIALLGLSLIGSLAAQEAGRPDGLADELDYLARRVELFEVRLELYEAAAELHRREGEARQEQATRERETAKARLDTTEAGVDKALRDLERVTELQSKGLVSEQQVNTSRTILAAKRAEQAAIAGRIRTHEAEIEAIGVRARRAEIESRLEVVNARLELLEARHELRQRERLRERVERARNRDREEAVRPRRADPMPGGDSDGDE